MKINNLYKRLQSYTKKVFFYTHLVVLWKKIKCAYAHIYIYEIIVKVV